MKTKLFLFALSAPLIGAGICVFHPGVAFAETPLAKLAAGQFPDKGHLTIDPMHTSVVFDIGHLGLSRVQGRFDGLSGAIEADKTDLSKCAVDFTIQTASVDTNVPPRDADLKSKNFFDVDQFPTITFKSKVIRKHGKGYVADGDLVVKGVDHMVAIPFSVYGPIKDPWGNARIGIVSDPITLNRQKLGITADPGLISDDVKIRLSVEATLDKSQS